VGRVLVGRGEERFGNQLEHLADVPLEAVGAHGDAMLKGVDIFIGFFFGFFLLNFDLLFFFAVCCVMSQGIGRGGQKGGTAR
jgi:hypothetical protein